MSIDNPDFPVRYPFIILIINERALKMFEAEVAPYIEMDPETGKKTYPRVYQPQVDTALREAEEWKTRVKDKAEKYIENDPCPDQGGGGPVIRAKYLDLIW